MRMISVTVVALLVMCWVAVVAAGESDPPALFIFGDSLLDSGNNNYIFSLSKANYAPNGIDFAAGPTGRFTNGRTIGDITGQELGVNGFIPPYLAPTTTGSVVLRGVNYASGAGGILNHTGVAFVGRINMDAQVDNFANTKQDIVSSYGAPFAENLISRKSMFMAALGSNDFINNYVPVAPIKKTTTPPETFVSDMITKYRLQLRRLYNLGARKFVVSNVGPIGCIPYVRDSLPAIGDNCVEFPNQIAQLFNTQLRSLVTELNANLPGSKFVYSDIYHIVDTIIRNRESYGFVNTNSSCCSFAGRHGGVAPCGAESRVCADRSRYFFWDPYHPSDASNVFISKRVLDSDDLDDVWPMNVRKLWQSSLP